MESQPDFSDEIEQRLSKYGTTQTGAELDRIETRDCASDNHDGREYSFYGNWIPIRPIIDEFASKDNYSIESMSHIDEGDPRLNVFVADVSEDNTHPAFVGDADSP
jgi:hypothetical protein